jgi:hypothetical protein
MIPVLNMIACSTDQANAILNPAFDLIYRSQRGLILGTEIYANLSSECFPGGLESINVLNFLPSLVCAGCKIGKISNTLKQLLTDITADILNFRTSVDNTRNALVRCRTDALADFLIKIGNTVSTAANCALGINA